MIALSFHRFYGGVDGEQLFLRLALDYTLEPIIGVPLGVGAIDRGIRFCGMGRQFAIGNGRLFNREAEFFGEGLFGEGEGGIIDNKCHSVAVCIGDLSVELRNGRQILLDYVEKLREGDCGVVDGVDLWPLGNFY